MKKNNVKLLSPDGHFLQWIPGREARKKIHDKTVDVESNFPFVVRLRETVERIGSVLVLREARNHQEEMHYIMAMGKNNKPRRACENPY